jgi:hypothetical protein
LADIRAAKSFVYPELAPYVRFSDDDRAIIHSLFQQIYSIIEQRKKDAHNARYHDLMRGYYSSPPRSH